MSNDSSDENGENENENMNGNMRKGIRAWGGSDAVLRRAHRIRTKGGVINNLIGIEERDKILEKAGPKLKENPKYTILTDNLDCKFVSIKVMLGF